MTGTSLVEDERCEPVPTELLEAIQAFPLRWSRMAIAVATALRGQRTVWAWCEAMDDADRALLAIITPESKTRLRT